MKKILNIVSFSLAGLLFAGLAFGWTNPSGTPPAGSGALNADTSGNVGIGTSASVSYKLNVSGKSRGTELCIGSVCRSTWPSAGLGITGTPALNKMTKFTDVTSGAVKIGNSIVVDDGTKLDVAGQVKATGFCIGTNCLTGWGPFSANKIPKAVTATTLGDSAITDSAGNIGVGIVTPARKLHVGAVGFRLTSGVLPSSPATGDIAIDSADGNKFKWYDGTAWKTATAAVANYAVSCSAASGHITSSSAYVGGSCSMECAASYAISGVVPGTLTSVTYNSAAKATCSTSGTSYGPSCTATCVRTAP